MRAQRILWFSIAIAFGVGAGLLAGWVFFPPAGSAAAEPESLRSDFKSDYVLMAAEIYAKDGNVVDAALRLQFLGSQPALDHVQVAILTGQDLGYTQADMQKLASLFTALQSYATAQPSATP